MLYRVSYSMFFQKTDLGTAASEHSHVKCANALEASKGKVLDTPGKPGTHLFFFLAASHRTDMVHRGGLEREETKPTA